MVVSFLFSFVFPFCVLPTVLIVLIASTCPLSPAPRCPAYKSRPPPLVCWTVSLLFEYRMFIFFEFLVLLCSFSSSRVAAVGSSYLSAAWTSQSQKVTDVGFPLTFQKPLGLIREILAENLPKCGKLWGPAAGRIRMVCAAGQLQTWEMKPHLLMWKEGLRSNVSTFKHVPKIKKKNVIPHLKWYPQFTSLVFVSLNYSESKTKQSQFCDYAIQRLF